MFAVSEQSSSVPTPDSQSEGLSESDGSSSKISLERYEEEWTSLTSQFDLDRFKKMSMDGELRASRFRSVYWRIFLKILSKDPRKWATEITDHRKLYDGLMVELDASPWSSTSTCVSDNPLSQEHGVSIYVLFTC